ncbi:hypothetical protein, partial [Sutterella wadsworthensis]|uniref:hypothetical protein n=1 Tax=Sutterella wadsworthensis TaxID=40545 RepID=UPI003AB98F02
MLRDASSLLNAGRDPCGIPSEAFAAFVHSGDHHPAERLMKEQPPLWASPQDFQAPLCHRQPEALSLGAAANHGFLLQAKRAVVHLPSAFFS